MSNNPKAIQLAKDLQALRLEASKERQLSKDHYKAFQTANKKIMKTADELALIVN